LSKDFPDPIKIPTPLLEGDEVIVGVHASGIVLEEGLNVSLSRNYCSNCKRKTHCHVEVDRDTNEAIIYNSCTHTKCECRCKTHFACKRCGYLHPYGHKCTHIETERKIDPKADAEFQKIMDGWKKDQTSKTKIIKKKKEAQ